MDHPHCKAVFGRKFSKSCQNRAQNGGFSGKEGLNVKLLFSNPDKAHRCVEPRWGISRENRFGGLGCGALEEPKKDAE